MNGGQAGRRAITRWAIRLFRREWRQQVLVLALLVVAVAAAIAGSAMAINGASDSTGRLGAGQAILRFDTVGRDTAASIATAQDRFASDDLVAHSTTTVPGSVRTIDVRDQNPDGQFSRPMLDVVDGRYPTVGGEVAVTRAVATLFGAGLGDPISVSDASATVVGIVENPAQLDDAFVLVAPGTIASPEAYELLVDNDDVDRVMRSGGAGGSFGIMVGGSDDAAVAVLVLVAVTLALSLVALIASAGFVVVAQRRQRQLGLVGAIGATQRQVRLVMVVNGLIVALVASVVGGLLGVAGWLIAAPAVESAANHRIDRLDMPWLMSALILLLAIVTSALAAWWPARVASRQSVMTALSGRPARPRPVHRSIVVALALVGVGVYLVVTSHATARTVRPLPLVGGLVAIVIGAVFAAPGAVRALGFVARRLPFAPRLALRDLARYQARAAASLAAITLGLGISVGVIVIAQSSEDSAAEGNLSANELLITTGRPDEGVGPIATSVVDDVDPDQLDARAAAVVAALGAGYTSVPLDLAYAEHAGGTRAPLPAGLGIRRDAHSIEDASLPYVASAELLALYGIDPDAIDPTADIITVRTEPLVLVVPPALAEGEQFERKGDADFQQVPAQQIDLPAWHSAPNSLITEGGMQRRGLVPVRAGWIIESDHGFTSSQLSAARAAAATVGLAVESRDGQDGLSSVRTGATLVGALLAIAIVAMTVGLIRGEAASDLRTMTATGAGSRTRRAITASTAAALAGLGVLLGIGCAYIALVAAYHADLDRLLPVPIENLLTLAVGLPVIATLGGWLLAGREPGVISRRSLE